MSPLHGGAALTRLPAHHHPSHLVKWRSLCDIALCQRDDCVRIEVVDLRYQLFRVVNFNTDLLWDDAGCNEIALEILHALAGHVTEAAGPQGVARDELRRRLVDLDSLFDLLLSDPATRGCVRIDLPVYPNSSLWIGLLKYLPFGDAAR